MLTLAYVEFYLLKHNNVYAKHFISGMLISVRKSFLL